MIIAIPTNNEKVSGHFGRCREFTFYEVEDTQIKNRSLVDTSAYQPCHLPGFFKTKGVDCVIGGNMGARSQGMFKGKNIQLVLGVTGSVDDVVQKFLAGTLESGNGDCSGHQGQGCHHGQNGQHGQQAQHGQHGQHGQHEACGQHGAHVHHHQHPQHCGHGHGNGGCGHRHGGLDKID